MKPVKFTTPTITWREKLAVQRVMNSGWYGPGEKVREFERMLREYIGAKHVVATNSCTTALFTALHALGIRHGDNVLVPSTTFAATANAAWCSGANLFFVDVNAREMSIDAASVEHVLSHALSPPNSHQRTFLINTYYAGTPYCLSSLLEICEKYNCTLISDAAHAIGTKLNGKQVGTREIVSCFSFNTTKQLTTLGGGALITNDDEIATFAKTFINQGRDGEGGSYNVVGPGFHGYMTDYHATIGIEQLKRIDTFLAHRQKIAKFYNLHLPSPIRQDCCTDGHSYYIYPIFINNARKLQRSLALDGFQCSFHYPSLHKSPFYSQLHDGRRLPGAEFVDEHQLSLPMGNITNHQQDILCRTLKSQVIKKN